MIVHVFALTAPVEPTAVWRHWVDVDQWPDHFPGLKTAKLNGPVAVGAVGLVKPLRGRRWSFRIAEVDRSKKRFAIERKLLFTTLRFSFALDRPEEIEDGDTLEPQLPSDPDTWTATYTVTLKGTLAAIYDRTAARPIARQLERLAASVAESSPPQD